MTMSRFDRLLVRLGVRPEIAEGAGSDLREVVRELRERPSATVKGLVRAFADELLK
jgi:hypothetical protein